MVSIMPGMDMAEPERTDTSRGLAALPNPLPVLASRAFIWAWTSSMTPGGRVRAGEARYSRQAAVEMTKPGGTFRPNWVISHRLAPLPPSSFLSLPLPSSKAKTCFVTLGSMMVLTSCLKGIGDEWRGGKGAECVHNRISESWAISGIGGLVGKAD